ncbi:MAG: hypothetical protein J6K42_04055 [Clostridia bacterium]|nr:hypothetical protein [Clostridia bacterium]
MDEKSSNKKVTSKKTKSNIVVLLLIIAILASAIFGYYAYSKYSSTLTGNSASTIAKWGFKVNGATEQFATIELDKTMTAVNNIMPNRVAPGTKGAMLLALDATECEVAVDYTITIDVAQKPTNLKMYEKYENDTYSEEIVPENGIMTVTGIIPLNQIGTVQNKYIYWQWPYETGTEKNEIEKNDETDTIDSNKGSIVLPITVTAVQRNTSKPEGPTLAELVKVGDYVNYNAASGNGAGKSYTTEESLTGNSTTATFSSSDTMKWKVMSVNKATGTVELMAENPTANTVTLYGKTGYKNAETVLNKVGAVYGYGDGATGGRSITVEDVNKLENYMPTDDTTTSYTYTSGTFINEDGTEVTATTDNSVTMSYTASTAEKSTNKYYGYTTTNFSGKSFWLASRCINSNPGNSIFFVRTVRSGGVSDNFTALLVSNGGEIGCGWTALPVVSLKSNIQTSGKDESGAWNLVIE